MGKIFCITGKSGSGKDTVFNSLMAVKPENLKQVVTYTTRPMRDGEKDGREYYFTDNEDLKRLEAEGRVIEKREYHTEKGVWTYFTCTIDITKNCDYIMIGTLDVVDKLYEIYDAENIVVIYLELDDRIRLLRCMSRESKQKNPDYKELCRRFIADENDFLEERFLKYKYLYRIDSFNTSDENTAACLAVIEENLTKFL